MQVLPGKHAAEMPMVGPIGHCKGCCGSFSQATCQLLPSGWSPKTSVSSRLLGEGSRTLEDLCCVLRNKVCIMALEEQNQWDVYI